MSITDQEYSDLQRENLELRDQVEQLTRELDRARNPFPCDGIWLVRDTDGGRRSECISFLTDLPDPVPLAAIALHGDAIARAVQRTRESIRGSLTLKPRNAEARWTFPASTDVARQIIEELYAESRQFRRDEQPYRYPVLSAEEAEAEATRIRLLGKPDPTRTERTP